METIDASTRFILNSNAAFTFIDEEAVLLSDATQVLYGINSVGSEILKQLSHQPISVAAIRDNLIQQFAVEGSQCLTDTAAFLRSLLTENVVIRVD